MPSIPFVSALFVKTSKRGRDSFKDVMKASVNFSGLSDLRLLCEPCLGDSLIIYLFIYLKFNAMRGVLGFWGFGVLVYARSASVR